MKSILTQLNKEDIVYISKRLDNITSFTNDKKRNKLIEKTETPSDELIDLIDKQIRYFGSSDVASIYRKTLKKEAFVTSNEILDDITKKMKFNINKHQSIENKLKRLVKEIVRKELSDAKPEDLEKMLKKSDLNYSDIEEVIRLIDQDDGDIVETMIDHLGQNLATELIFEIMQRTILLVAGETAFKFIVAQFIRKNPGFQILGPAVWVLTGAWFAFDLQGPAYRKTIPICLYIGMKLISKEVEERNKQKRIDDDKYNSLENEETQKIIKENEDLKQKYKELSNEVTELEKEMIKAEKSLDTNKNKQNIQNKKLEEEHELLRKQYNALVLRNSQTQKMGIKKIDFKVGQVRGIRDVFPTAIGMKANKLILQDSYIRGKESELEDLLRQFLNLNIIKRNTEITFISLVKYGEVPSTLYAEMNPKLQNICNKYNFKFMTLKLRRNNEVHSRIFLLENDEMHYENSPDHSFYNLDRNNFAFRTFEEIKFK